MHLCITCIYTGEVGAGLGAKGHAQKHHSGDKGGSSSPLWILPTINLSFTETPSLNLEKADVKHNTNIPSCSCDWKKWNPLLSSVLANLANSNTSVFSPSAAVMGLS